VVDSAGVIVTWISGGYDDALNVPKLIVDATTHSISAQTITLTLTYQLTDYPSV